MVYDIQSYSGPQGGWSLTGSITTDGTIGTLTASDITAWNFSMSEGSTTYEASSAEVNVSMTVNQLQATATQLTLAPASSMSVSPELQFESFNSAVELYYERELGPSFYYEVYEGGPAYATAWALEQPSSQPYDGLGGTTWIIGVASVPEPGSLTLALLGIGCLAVAGPMTRRTLGHRVLGR